MEMMEAIAALAKEVGDLKELLSRTASPWMNTTEVAAYTRLAPQTIRQYVSKKQIPVSYPKGVRRPMFNRAKIDAWINTVTIDGSRGRRR